MSDLFILFFYDSFYLLIMVYFLMLFVNWSNDLSFIFVTLILLVMRCCAPVRLILIVLAFFSLLCQIDLGIMGRYSNIRLEFGDLGLSFFALVLTLSNRYLKTSRMFYRNLFEMFDHVLLYLAFLVDPSGFLPHCFFNSNYPQMKNCVCNWHFES